MPQIPPPISSFYDIIESCRHTHATLRKNKPGVGIKYNTQAVLQSMGQGPGPQKMQLVVEDYSV